MMIGGSSADGRQYELSTFRSSRKQGIWLEGRGGGRGKRRGGGMMSGGKEKNAIEKSGQGWIQDYIQVPKKR